MNSKAASETPGPPTEKLHGPNIGGGPPTPANWVPKTKHPKFKPKGSTTETKSLVKVQLLEPSVTVNGVKAGEVRSVTKVGESNENEKLWIGPVTAE
jgi:hypothetical protein